MRHIATTEAIRPDRTLVQQLDSIVILASHLHIDGFFDEGAACALILAGATALEVHSGENFLKHFVDEEAANSMRASFQNIRSLTKNLEMEDMKISLHHLRGKLTVEKPQPEGRARKRRSATKS
jgi:hypothetical protein